VYEYHGVAVKIDLNGLSKILIGIINQHLIRIIPSSLELFLQHIHLLNPFTHG
jgi:hypothetical protein